MGEGSFYLGGAVTEIHAFICLRPTDKKCHRGSGRRKDAGFISDVEWGVGGEAGVGGRGCKMLGIKFGCFSPL